MARLQVQAFQPSRWLLARREGAVPASRCARGAFVLEEQRDEATLAAADEFTASASPIEQEHGSRGRGDGGRRTAVVMTMMSSQPRRGDEDVAAAARGDAGGGIRSHLVPTNAGSRAFTWTDLDDDRIQPACCVHRRTHRSAERARAADASRSHYAHLLAL